MSSCHFPINKVPGSADSKEGVTCFSHTLRSCADRRPNLRRLLHFGVKDPSSELEEARAGILKLGRVGAGVDENVSLFAVKPCVTWKGDPPNTSKRPSVRILFIAAVLLCLTTMVPRPSFVDAAVATARKTER